MAPKLRSKREKRFVKCGFSHQPNGAGDCRECGEPAEPGAKRLCIDCAIESGTAPVKPRDDGKVKTNQKK